MEIPEKCYGWWRIVDTDTWGQNRLDILGPALISLTGRGDRLRMHCLLADVEVQPTKSGVSFSWRGAWEYDQLTGRGTAKVGSDGRLRGTIKINDGDSSSFVAEKSSPPDRPIPDPPSYRDKWGRR